MSEADEGLTKTKVVLTVRIVSSVVNKSILLICYASSPLISLTFWFLDRGHNNNELFIVLLRRSERNNDTMCCLFVCVYGELYI
jgi:hypothetical protein